MGNALTDQNDFEKGIPAYEEALTKYRKLAEANPAVYLPYVAGTLNNMGVSYLQQENAIEAISFLNEANSIKLSLAQENLARFGLDACQTLMALIFTYQQFPDLPNSQEQVQSLLIQHVRN